MLFRHIYVLSLIVILSLAGCKSNTEVSTDEVGDSAKDSSLLLQDSTPAGPNQNIRAGREELAALAEEWNNAFSQLHIAELPKYYADEVSYYGKTLKRDELVQLKKDYLTAHPDIEKNTLSAVTVEILPGGGARVNFSRTLEMKKGVEAAMGYIVFRQMEGGWKITHESEMVADMKRLEAGSKPMKEKEIVSCDKAAEAIFRSSPIVQAMLRSPNAQYKVEYKPGDPENPNRRYWFWVFGSPMVGTQTDTYGRFQVDPQTGELYQFDAILDKTKVVPSDEALKKYIKKYCGK
jgi:hypothetical protein